MKINIIGNTEGPPTGYQVHTSNTVKALKDLGHEVTLNKPEADTTIMITLPDWFRIHYPENHEKLVGFVVFEGTGHLPLNWVRNIKDDRLDLVFTPSNHTKEAIETDCSGKKIIVIPHGHNPDVFKSEGEKVLQEDKRFKFLFVGGWREGIRDRKGLDIALRAFKQEFKNQDDVVFKAKINTAYGGNIKGNLDNLNLPIGLPSIDILFDTLTEEQLASLYRSCDVFVLSTKAEAFAMPCLESLACGTPVIATNYGGQTDYVTNKNGWLIDYEMIPATSGDYIYERAQWAEPDQSHLQKLMREAYENPKLRRRKSLNGLRTAKKYTWTATAKKIITALR